MATCRRCTRNCLTLSCRRIFLAVNWPFVDVTPERGPFQMAEGTHLLPKAEALARIEAGEIPLKSLLMEVGDVMIRDPRCLHRGSPNLTSTPRVMAGFGLVRPGITATIWTDIRSRAHSGKRSPNGSSNCCKGWP